ncbi:DMT family transporter [Reinekea sp.]|jgi:drug/metabolite transporter (DMT)-like permease|uniref:DMT family transporter n=1 Tax=Reinekea sp. TaxID=1970455 RepID=UPI002A8372DB|nr:DMT family transporter [Reinekea sp.]
MNTTLRAHLALLLAMILWGSSFIALKITVNEMSPMIVIFLRMAIGTVAFLVVWPWLRHGFVYQAGDWKFLLGMVLFEPCLYFLFESQALRYTSAGQAGMVTAMLPLMVAIAAYFFLGERNNLKQWIGFLIAVAGVIAMTLTGENSEQAPNAILGNFLEFLAMVTAVGYTLLIKHLVKRYSAFVLTALQSFSGVLFYFPLALMSDWPSQISLSTMGWLVYLGLVVTLGAYGLYNFSLGFVKASTAAGYANLLPVFTLLFSMLILGERLTMIQWIAISVVFVGVYLSYERRSSIPKEVPPGITG